MRRPPVLSLISHSGSSSHSIQSLNEFQATHTFDFNGYADYYDQQYAYPFELYRLVTVFVVLDHATNQSLPILSISAVDQVKNLVATSADWSTSSPNPTNAADARVPSRSLCLYLKRPTFLKAFVVTLFCINWFLTAAVVYVTVTTLWGKEVSESVVLLPVSVILTIPGTRALWVGAPAFGMWLNISFGLADLVAKPLHVY